MILRPLQAFVVLLAASIALAAQSPPPRFEDYAATDIFSGTPSAPILVSAQARAYRTRIREGVARGTGVFRDGKEQPGANFAGHYIVITWVCGSPCGMLAIVDATTGKVYSPPLLEGFLLPSLPAAMPGNPDAYVPRVADVQFQLNSRLMIIKANPDPGRGRTSYAHYFLWNENRWSLLRRIAIQPE